MFSLRVIALTTGINLFSLVVLAQSFISRQLPEIDQLVNGTRNAAITPSNEGHDSLQPWLEVTQQQESGASQFHEELDSAALEYIAGLIDSGESNLALSKLVELSGNIKNGVSGHPDFTLLESRLYLLIRAHFLLGHNETVEKLADEYFEQFVNGEHFHWVYYYLSFVLSSQRKPLKQVYLVTEDFFSELPKQERYNLRKFLIENAVHNNEFLSAIYFLEDEDGKLIQGYELWIDDIIENINEIEDIEQILERNIDANLYYQLQLRKIQLMIRNGSIAVAEEYYNQLVSKSGSEAIQFEKQPKIYETIQLARNTKPYRIGVILPISHKHFRLLAEQVLDGLEIALQKIEIEGKPIQLIIKDYSQKDDSPEFKKLSPQLQLQEREKLVKNQVKDLVENYGVIAILGPLDKSTSIAAGEAGSRYRIPIISFSLTENVGENLPSLFRFQQSQFQEAIALADYAVGYLNAKRFILFYDTSSKSFDVMQTFADEIKGKGGSVVGISRINPNQEDFTDSFKSFTGGLREMTEEEQDELKKTRERPDPIVDFDAVFLPANIRTLKVVMDFAKLFDAENVWVLSGSEINVQENQLLSNSKRIRFVDTFPVSGAKTYLQSFFETHWKYFNFRTSYSRPTNYTIYGYEALEIVGKLLQNPLNYNREALKNSIRSLKSFAVLTGEVTTAANGEINKRLKILKIVGNETVEVF
jgi:ABC-type branched-subunit amino acid transport system substrate-binding protein